MNLLDKIGSSLKQAAKWVSSIFSASNESKLKAVVQTMQNIKKAIDSDLAVSITAIIPGNIDDKLRLAISVGLGKILYLLVPSKSTKEQVEALVQDAVKYLKPKDKSTRNLSFANWGGRLMSDISNMDQDAAYTAVKDYYDQNKEAINA